MEYGKRIYTSYGWMKEEPMTELEKILYLLRAALEDDPHPSLIYAARYVLTEFDRSLIPDWVATLAGGNSDLWEDVVDEVRRSIEAEEVE